MFEQTGILAEDILGIITQRRALAGNILVFVIVQGKATDIGTELFPHQRQVRIQTHGIGNNPLVVVQVTVIIIG